MFVDAGHSNDRIGAVVAVALDVSEATALSAATIGEVDAACKAVDAISAGRALIVKITGSDCPGREPHWPGDVGLQLISQWERALRKMERLDALTIAVATGHCSAMALDILMAADYRMGTSDVSLLLSSARAMIWPGMSLHRLVARVGLNKARRLLVSGGRLSVDDALDIGIFDEIVKAQEELRSRVEERVNSAANEGYSLRRLLLLEGATSTYEEALGLHLAACERELRRRRNCSRGPLRGDEA